MSTLTQVPPSLQKGVFFKFFKQAKLNRLSKEDLAVYVNNWKNHSDHINSIKFAEKTAENKGRAEEKAEGKIKEMGFSIAQILEITELSMAELEENTHGAY